MLPCFGQVQQVGLEVSGSRRSGWSERLGLNPTQPSSSVATGAPTKEMDVLMGYTKSRRHVLNPNPLKTVQTYPNSEQAKFFLRWTQTHLVGKPCLN